MRRELTSRQRKDAGALATLARVRDLQAQQAKAEVSAAAAQEQAARTHLMELAVALDGIEPATDGEQLRLEASLRESHLLAVETAAQRTAALAQQRRDKAQSFLAADQQAQVAFQLAEAKAKQAQRMRDRRQQRTADETAAARRDGGS